MPGQKADVQQRREQILRAAFEVAVQHGLDGLTVRRVATAAGLSHGLVHFHFRSKADLLSALLDWVLRTTPAFEVGPEIQEMDVPLDRLLALLRQELTRLVQDRGRIHVFFDFWLMGTRHARIRMRMRRELERYRSALRPMVDEVLRAEPERFAGVQVDGLCAAIVAFIKGSAVQSVIDPGAFDIAQFTVAAQALFAQMEPAAP